MPLRLEAIMSQGSQNITRVNRDIRRDRLRQAMEDSLQIIMLSTLAGFVKRESPDGTPWSPNPQWYADMKGQSTPLTGPVSKNIQGGPFAGTHEFESVNVKRMKNSLMKTNNTTRGVVEYEEQAKPRARLNQHGGRHELAIVVKQGMGTGRLSFPVHIMERPHLGIADYPRISPRTDAEWVEFYFGEQVDIQLRDDFS